MNKFLIFFKRGQDQQSRVDAIRGQAEACQYATAKAFSIRAVDVSVAGDADLKHWCGNTTIECVTTAQNAVVDREVMPPASGVGRLVRGLP